MPILVIGKLRRGVVNFPLFGYLIVCGGSPEIQVLCHQSSRSVVSYMLLCLTELKYVTK